MRIPTQRNMAAYAILDRCGSSWITGKGGCGILIQAECSNTIATAFNPLVFTSRTRDLPGAQMRERCAWKRNA